MTYEQWLRRYLELAAARPPTRHRRASPRLATWLDITFRDRFEELLDRALARVHPETSGPIERSSPTTRSRATRRPPIDTLVAEYPEAHAAAGCTPPTCTSSSRCAAARASRSTSSP